MVKYKASKNAEEKRERFIDICERYKSENPAVKEKALEDAIQELDGFIHDIIRKRYSTYTKHYEDLAQVGRMGIMVGMPKYDPTRTLPTTYFNVHIIHEMSKYIDEMVNETTPHYSANLMKINRAINKFNQEGRAWNLQDIAVETGIRMETIVQCMAINEGKNKVYYDADDVEDQVKDISKSPEEQIIENEKLATLYKAVADLSPIEKAVIIKKYGLGAEGQLSYKTISDEYGIPVEKIKKIRHEAVRKLHNNKRIRDAYRSYERENEANMVNRSNVSIVPEEIANALMDHLEDIELDAFDVE